MIEKAGPGDAHAQEPEHAYSRARGGRVVMKSSQERNSGEGTNDLELLQW